MMEALPTRCDTFTPKEKFVIAHFFHFNRVFTSVYRITENSENTSHQKDKLQIG
jgi:hypothetical protein